MNLLPDFHDQLEHDRAARGDNSLGEWLDRHWDPLRHVVVSHMPHHAATAAPDIRLIPTAPATEEHMSLAADVENGFAAIKDEVAKFEQNLPGLLDTAKKLEGNPVADIAVKVAEAAAASVLPPEAVTLIADSAGKLLDGLIELYGPAAGTPAPVPAA